MNGRAPDRNTKARKELEEAVERAIRSIGHIPEPAVIAVLPDDTLELILDESSAAPLPEEARQGASPSVLHELATAAPFAHVVVPAHLLAA